MRCKQAQDRLMQRLLGELPAQFGPAVNEHLSTCPACRAFWAEQVSLEPAVAQLQSEPVLPPLQIGSRISNKRPSPRPWALGKAAAVATMAAVAAGLIFAVAPGLLRPQPTELPASIFTHRPAGTGWIATAGIALADGPGILYLHVADGQYALVIRHPDGRITREVELGAITFGRHRYTQPEFSQLTLQGREYFALLSDNPTADGQARLQVYTMIDGRLTAVQFDRQPELLVRSRPRAAGDRLLVEGIAGGQAWRLAKQGHLAVEPDPVPWPTPDYPEVLAETAIAPGRLRLTGTVSQGARLELVRPGQSSQVVAELGKPHFGNLPITQPQLHKVSMNGVDLILLLSDPMIGKPRQASLRVFAFDPAEGYLRPIPFATGEALVDQVPTVEHGLLVTAANMRWQLSSHWLLEPMP